MFLCHESLAARSQQLILYSNLNWLLFDQFPFTLQSHQPPRLDLPPEESTDLEELEQFAKMFKQKRIKLGKCNKVCKAFLDLRCYCGDTEKKNAEAKTL